MVIIADETGVYASRLDGTRDYAWMTSLQIDGKKVYDFDQQTGILRISMQPGDLEVLLAQLGEIPETGIDLTLPTPFYVDGPARFRGVRRVESISGLADNEYVMRFFKPEPKEGISDSQSARSLEQNQVILTQQETFFQRAKYYFNRFFF